jgi:hypothetical protein
MMNKCEKRNTTSSPGTQKQRSGSERGVALVLVLVLSTIGLIVMTTVLYMITMGTQISGSEKRYRTAHEAALGAFEVIRQIIQDQGASVLPGVTVVYEPTFLPKVTGPNMTASRIIDANDPNTYDLAIDLGNPVYRVYAKIVQKQRGNTNLGYKLVRIKTGVVPADPGMGVKTFTYYTFTIIAQKATNPQERVRMDLVQTF